MGKLQRDRGHNYEREIAKALTALLGKEHKRVLGQERDSGGDVSAEDANILWECKRRRELKCVYEWMEQAEVSAMDKFIAGDSANSPDIVPAVVFRGDHENSIVMLRLEDIIYFAREVLGDA